MNLKRRLGVKTITMNCAKPSLKKQILFIDLLLTQGNDAFVCHIVYAPGVCRVNLFIYYLRFQPCFRMSMVDVTGVLEDQLVTLKVK